MTTIYKQVTFRPGADLTHELRARGDNINEVARRCVLRYLEMVNDSTPQLAPETARRYFEQWRSLKADQWDSWISGSLYDWHSGYSPVEAMAVTDALERCSRLLTQGVELDQALREVGLVR